MAFLSSSPSSSICRVSISLLLVYIIAVSRLFPVQAHGLLKTLSRLIELPSEVSDSKEDHNVRRSDFPSGFLIGAATSALQTEGSTKTGKRSPSVWEHFIKKYPDRVVDRSDFQTGIDSYRRYKEDIEALKDIGADAYRFSISWTRIFPNGSFSGGINLEGIDHYNRIIDMLVEYGIKPFVTLLHFDLPQSLEEKYGGFLSNTIVNDFRDYCELCFRTFGDRVKNWITINEPLTIVEPGYDLGLTAPGRCSKCSAGNSSTEPYIVNHNILLSHAAVAKLYKEKYQADQGGEIGLTVVGEYYEPYSEAPEDKAAQQRILDFKLGWYMEPLVYGDYPRIMRKLVKQRLPTFSWKEKKLVKGSFDFIGINYYTSSYAKSIPMDPKAPPMSFTCDMYVNSTETRNGNFIGPKAEGSSNIYVYPQGLQKVLEYVKQRYQNPKIYVTENGVTENRNDSRGLVEALDDQHRINYIRQHLYRIQQAIKNGVNVQGYFYWSLFDSFEWLGGYTVRFGLYYIDYMDNLKRIPKLSALWLHDFMRGDKHQGY
ncbi:hypothetical protein K2173_007847 [Erythroxylum novogranatense]|uniref:Beta-glucosidase n=1 Tax=Erythroxylum novogranatense TaxID=1862640 RepID=A0AAV8S7D9_9ROSI|nr:hypothetical protein K2173_007847 [Erythroxylum novogranatense]